MRSSLSLWARTEHAKMSTSHTTHSTSPHTLLQPPAVPWTPRKSEAIGHEFQLPSYRQPPPLLAPDLPNLRAGLVLFTGLALSPWARSHSWSLSRFSLSSTALGSLPKRSCLFRLKKKKNILFSSATPLTIS